MGTYKVDAQVINRPSFAHVQVKLGGDTAIISDAGAMLWQINSGDDGISMDTGCHLGGCYHGCWRTCARESFCFNRYEGEGEIAFGFDLPGDIIPFACNEELGFVLTKGAFVCGTENICISSKWKGCAAFCCSGEGGMLTHVMSDDGMGIFYAGSFGMIQKQKIPDDLTLCVNTGLFFGGPEDIIIDVEIAGGCCSSACWCSQEGFVMRFTGPLTVYTQNRDPEKFMALLQPMPQGGGGGGGEAAGAAAGA